MKFELSERVVSTFSHEELLVALEAQLRKISEGVVRSGQVIEAKSIQATFGSINRNDITYFHVNKVHDGWLLIADVSYKPSIAFWIILLLTLFTWVFWLLPIAFYLLQKDGVKTAIENCFQRIKNEFDQSFPISGIEYVRVAEEIEKLGSLRERGLLTDDEFSLKKRQLLGI